MPGSAAAVTPETTRIKSFCVPSPRRNLPEISSMKRGENGFARAFQRAFVAEQDGLGLGGHEFEVFGYGIADFVWAECPNVDSGRHGDGCYCDDPEGAPQQVRLTAFEMKLDHWRKALQQAYRYTYFADRAIVVLPKATAKLALTALSLFQDLRVGLWSFDKASGRISKLFTPRSRRPRNPAAKEKALQLLLRKFDLRCVRESR